MLKNSVKNENKRIIPHLRSSVNSLFAHKIIFYPFLLGALIQTIILEILFFAPRYPLNVFFGPIIKTFWGAQYTHYPFYFLLLPKIFQYIQFGVYVFLSGYLISIGVGIIQKINDDQPVRMRQLMNTSLKQYVHIFIAALLIFVVVFGLFEAYGLLMKRALLIRSESGMFYIIKRIVVEGASYFQLLISVFITAIFAYVFPIITLRKKKVFGALIENFKIFFSNPFFTFTIILIPTLLYLPMLIIRTYVNVYAWIPEANTFVLLLNIFLTAFIDAIIYSSITIYYLLVREKQ
jgi:hypothetical protein